METKKEQREREETGLVSEEEINEGKVLVDREDTKVVEYGESFKGKVEYRKEKKYGGTVEEEKISGPSFSFSTEEEVEEFIENLKEASKNMKGGKN